VPTAWNLQLANGKRDSEGADEEGEVQRIGGTFYAELSWRIHGEAR
jgi:hypothetical protein